MGVPELSLKGKFTNEYKNVHPINVYDILYPCIMYASKKCY